MYPTKITLFAMLILEQNKKRNNIFFWIIEVLPEYDLPCKLKMTVLSNRKFISMNYSTINKNERLIKDTT